MTSNNTDTNKNDSNINTNTNTDNTNDVLFDLKDLPPLDPNSTFSTAESQLSKELEQLRIQFVETTRSPRALTVDEIHRRIGDDEGSSSRKKLEGTPTLTARLASEANKAELVDSSGDEVDLYETEVVDDRQLQPIKSGWLKKESEQVHMYNDRWCILYPSFLLYYKNQPNLNRKKELTELNHPMGAIYLKNYHLRVRKDRKKCEFTLIPRSQAIQMNYASEEMKVCFRCPNAGVLEDWVNAIRMAIQAISAGYITYEVREKYLGEQLGGISLTENEEKMKQSQDETSTITNASMDNQEKSIASASRDTSFGARETSGLEKDNNCWSLDDRTPYEHGEDSKITTKIITIETIKKLMEEKQFIEDTLKAKENTVLSLQNELEQLMNNLNAKQVDLQLSAETHTKEMDSLKKELEESNERRNELIEMNNELRKKLLDQEASVRDLENNLQKSEEKNKALHNYAESMEQWNIRIRKNTMEELLQIYPHYPVNKLHDMCVKACQQMLQDLSNLYDENTYPTSTLMGKLMSNIKPLTVKYIETIIKNARLENEIHEMKTEMDTMQQYIYEEYEATDDQTTSSILQSQMAAPF